MKGKNLILTGLLTILLGLLLIIFRKELADGGVVFAGGVLFVIAGLLNMTVFLGMRNRNSGTGTFGAVFGWIASAAAVILGLAMLIFSQTFVALVSFMFAVLILFAALLQLGLLLFGSRPHNLSNWYFLVPTLLVCAAVYVFMREPDASGEYVVTCVTGASFILFGIASVVEGCVIGNANRTLAKAAARDTQTAVTKTGEDTEELPRECGDTKKTTEEGAKEDK